MKAFMHVRAPRRFAYRMKPPRAQFRFQLLDGFEMGVAFA
jgi:hypothetical protein